MPLRVSDEALNFYAGEYLRMSCDADRFAFYDFVSDCEGASRLGRVLFALHHGLRLRDGLTFERIMKEER